jgi:hypothetical protein
MNYGLPVVLLHRRMVELKANWIASLSEEKLTFLKSSRMYDVFSKDAKEPPETNVLNRAREYEMIRNIGEWPVTAGGFSRLLSATLIPLATYLLQFFTLKGFVYPT